MTRPPTGTVTLLMSDIEGSTQLWEAHPEEMSAALRRHDDLVRSAIEHSGGYVFKTVGDAFCAAFPTAFAAVDAAERTQRALLAEPWPAPVKLRVRMAVHSGYCEERDGDYFGPTVNRVARLESIAHGSQVLVSGVSAEMLADFPSESPSLRDLGMHRLKDLGRPEHVFQLVAPGLDSEFAPLRSLDNPELHNNLPVQLTSFVGRRHEVAEVATLVKTMRLVTLTGAGGAGKTRLALAAAAELLDGSGDGVWFVDFAPLVDPELVATAIATSVGVRDEPGRPILDTLADALSSRRLLLVLDNCEHVIDACVKLVDRLLRSCPEVHVLATSREALGLGGERRYRVPPLGVPHVGEDNGRASEAVALFVERARDQGQELVLDQRSASLIEELCGRLDGMPLAIELACARLGTMGLEDIASRLDQRFRLLTGGNRLSLPRHQTLRALIDWSYDLLSEPERVVFERLSVFMGSFDLAAAEVVATIDDVDAFEVIDILGALVEKSLVTTDGEALGLRYRLLETIRQYAADKLQARDESPEQSAALAHARHYLALAEEAAPQLVAHGEAEWLDRLDVEHDNLRVALDLFLQATYDGDDALRLAVALANFWLVRHFSEGVDSLRATLARSYSHEDSARRARALGHLARFLRGRGQEARTCIQEALSITAHLDQPELRAELLLALVWVSYEQRALGELDEITREALELALSNGSPYLIGRAYERRAMATIVGMDADPAECRAQFQLAIDCLQRAGARSEMSTALGNLANLETYQGNYGAARDGWENALAIANELRDEERASFALGELALLDLVEHDFSRAREHLEASLEGARRTGIRYMLPYIFLFFGICRSREGGPVDATLLAGTSQALFDEMDLVCEDFEVRMRDELVEDLRASLGNEFDETFRRGKNLSAAEACDIALRDASGGAPPNLEGIEGGPLISPRA